jgi:hypothetical protein
MTRYPPAPTSSRPPHPPCNQRPQNPSNPIEFNSGPPLPQEQIKDNMAQEARVACRVEGVSIVEVDGYKLPVAGLGELEEELLLLDTVGNSV